MKKALSLLIVCIFVLSVFPLTASADNSEPDWYADNYDFVIRNGVRSDETYVNAMRIAPGVWTTSAEIRNAVGMIPVSEAICRSKTDANGVLTYNMISGGVYSIWIRYSNNETYILSGVDMTDFTPAVGRIDGITITVDNLYLDSTKGIRDFWIARGTLNTYEDCRAAENLIVRITDTNIDEANYNYKRSYKYEMSYKNVSADGNFTLWVRTYDGRGYAEYFHIDYPEPEITVNGIQSTVTELETVKCVRVAPGVWDDASGVKTAPGVRVFTKKTILKDLDRYTIQYRNDGPYTLSIEYAGGYTVIRTIFIAHLAPNVIVNPDNTVTLDNLNQLYIIRYAPNPKNSTDWSQGYFKQAPGNRYAKTADLVNGTFTTEALPDLQYKDKNGNYTTSRIWSFMVQYTEESYNIFTIDFDNIPLQYYFNGGGFTFSDYSGTVGGEPFEGVRGVSYDYQPTFHFTQLGLNKVTAEAAAQGADMVRIHIYTTQYNNLFRIGDAWISPDMWDYAELKVADLSTDLEFYRQGERSTEVCILFDYYTEPTVSSGSFTSLGGSGYGFSLYSGTVGGVTFDGVKASTGRDDTYYKLNAYGVSRISDYAAANDYDTLVIHLYAECSDGAPYVNNTYVDGNTWVTVNVEITDLFDGFNFGNTSTGGNNMYMWFEFAKLATAPEPIVSDKAFRNGSASDYTFSLYSGTVDGVAFEGVVATATLPDTYFLFTDYGVNRIKGYAAENDYDTLVVHVYGECADGIPYVYYTNLNANEWGTAEITISDLTTGYWIGNTCTSGNTMYMWFEFTKTATGDEPVVSESSFSNGYGSDYTFSLYSGTVAGVTFDGVLASSSSADVFYLFNETGVTRIKNYASANGYTTMIIHVYGESADGAPYVNNAYIGANVWETVSVNIADLAAGFNFGNISTTGNNMYMWFEFS